VAIIGAGNIGGRLAADFAAGGQDFLLAGRDQEAARKIASGLDGHAEVVSVDEAVERAGVLVPAVWLDAFRQLIAQYGARLAGKVIVDPSNPVGPDGAGGYRKVIGEQESSGQILAGLLPTGARLVKAFGTLSSGSLSAAARQEPDRAVLFYAAHDPTTPPAPRRRAGTGAGAGAGSHDCGLGRALLRSRVTSAGVRPRRNVLSGARVHVGRDLVRD
jgi:8-hydroxy-5-deazaflavin:NADPH oxidoreductase